MEAITAVVETPSVIEQLKKYIKAEYHEYLDDILEDIHGYIPPEAKFDNRGHLRGALLTWMINDVTSIKSRPTTTLEILIDSISAGDPIVEFSGTGDVELFKYKYTDGHHYGGLFGSGEITEQNPIVWTHQPNNWSEEEQDTAEEFVLEAYKLKQEREKALAAEVHVDQMPNAEYISKANEILEYMREQGDRIFGNKSARSGREL